jgi:hypothetical protein
MSAVTDIAPSDPRGVPEIEAMIERHGWGPHLYAAASWLSQAVTRTGRGSPQRARESSSRRSRRPHSGQPPLGQTPRPGIAIASPHAKAERPTTALHSQPEPEEMAMTRNIIEHIRSILSWYTREAAAHCRRGEDTPQWVHQLANARLTRSQ